MAGKWWYSNCIIHFTVIVFLIVRKSLPFFLFIHSFVPVWIQKFLLLLYLTGYNPFTIIYFVAQISQWEPFQDCSWIFLTSLYHCRVWPCFLGTIRCSKIILFFVLCLKSAIFSKESWFFREMERGKWNSETSVYCKMQDYILQYAWTLNTC